jgi:hypothetical protein
MNIQGNDLAGDQLGVGYDGLTANLTDHAVVSAFAAFTLYPVGNVFNVSGQSSLTLELNRSGLYSPDTVNLSQNSTLVLGVGYTSHATVNVSGNDTTVIHTGSVGGSAEFHLAAGARLSGTFVGTTGTGGILIDGAAGSVFNNDGDSSFSPGGRVTLDVDVTGTGSITTPTYPDRFFKLEFARSVGSHQSIFDGDLVQIDQPNQFAASVTMTAASSEVDLMGLATADGYNYKNDMLNILSGNKIIDTLRLHDSTPNGFTVNLPTSGSSVVSIVANTDQTGLMAGLPNLTGVV